MRDAARRIATLVAVVFGVTACLSGLVGLLAGASLDRAVSVGFYLVGCLFIVLGFFSGVRGPLRPRGDDDTASPATLFGVGIFSSGARIATADERIDARATAWLFILLGGGLVVAGVLVDSRVGLT